MSASGATATGASSGSRTQPAAPPIDLNGSWRGFETITDANGASVTLPFALTVVHNGSAVSGTYTGGTFTGVLSGQTLALQGSDVSGNAWTGTANIQGTSPDHTITGGGQSSAGDFVGSGTMTARTFQGRGSGRNAAGAPFSVVFTLTR